MKPKATQTIVSRRDKITKAGSTMFVALAVAAVIVAFSAVSLKFLWSKKSYNDRVITAKTKAKNNTQTNLNNIEKLSQQFPALESSATVNSKSILHALPPVYDYAALATSVESLAQRSGVSFSGGIGEDTNASAIKDANVSAPLQIPLNMEVSGNYDQIVGFIKNLELSIRPIQVSSVKYSGTNSNIKASVQAVTYYEPVRNLDVAKSEVK